MNVTLFQPKRARLAALLTLLLFAAGMTKLQAQNITFDDPNVKALCVDNWDDNDDGELSYEEAADITDLGTVFKENPNITSFDELQYFTGLTSIGSYAFFNCENLTSVVFPGSIETIGDYAFTGCSSLTSLKLPSTLTSIGDHGFANCSGLQSITVLAPTPPQWEENAFEGVNRQILVFVPCEAMSSYLYDHPYGGDYGWGWFTNFQGLGSYCRIVFADANVESLCINKWGNTIILSYEQAADVTDLESVFKGNTEITSFNELQYFTGLTAIGDSAFYGCTSLSSIMIPDNVATIGSSAFDHCNSLSSIEIPGAVDSIAKKAFSSCPGLASMRVASGNATYDSRNRCNAIIETATNTLVAGCIATVIPDDVVSIGDYAFHGLTGLTSVVFPDLLTSIGEGAFGCTDLTSVTIPANVTFIGKEAFAQCTGLESITVHANTPPALGADAFDGVDVSIPVIIPAGTLEDYQTAEGWNQFTNLVEASDPIAFADANMKALCANKWGSNGELTYTQAAAVTDLESVFKGNTSITSFDELQYFTGLTAIGDSAFHGCQNLASVRIPNGVTSIGTGAFSDCGSLVSIEIHRAVIAIGTGVFSGCSSLASIAVASDNRIYDSRNDCNAIIETATNTLVAGCKNTVVPYTITTIAGRAFYGCTGLTSFVVPHPVAYIGAYAFYQCSGLTTLQLLCPLSFIDDYAFALCTSIDSLTLEATTPPALGTDVFQGVDTSIPVHIPYGTYSDYRNATDWSSFTNLIDPANIVFADANVKAICVTNWDTNEDGELNLDEAAAVNRLAVGISNQSVFKNNAGITSFDELQYFTGLTSIMDEAFLGCASLTSIKIPNSVTSIGARAFEYCISLTSFEIPSSVNSIKTRAFGGCSSLESLTVWAIDPPYLNGAEDVFQEVTLSIPVYVPCAARLAYLNYYINSMITRRWGEFENFIGTGSTCFIDFADANVMDLCVANWDTNGDGELSYDEAAAVTDLELVFEGNTEITSFDELQYFTGLDSIGDYAFRFCTGLTSVTIPTSVTVIGKLAFAFCYELSSIEIPNSVAAIGNNAFVECYSLPSFEIPNSVTAIGEEAFYGCSLLNSIAIPNSVNSIGKKAFCACFGLTSMMVAPDNQYYDSRNGCNAIIETATNTLVAGCKNTVIPQSVVAIDDLVFSGFSNMESLTVWPTTPPALGSDVFDGVNTSIPVYIPAGTLADYRAAEGWKRFTHFVERGNYIVFADANVKNICVDNWGSDGQLSYDEAFAVTDLNGVFMNQPITSFNELQYFMGLTAIGDSVFHGCQNLASVCIPNSVQSIGVGAFNSCTNLASIEIPNMVSTIGEGAFVACNALASMTVDVGNQNYDSRDNCNAIIEKATNTLVAGCKNTVIPNAVTAIGDYALSINSLSWIEIPANVTSIGEEAFAHCTGLDSLTVHATTPPTLGINAFNFLSKSFPVYVPCLALDAYESYSYGGHSGWGGFTNFVGMDCEYDLPIEGHSTGSGGWNLIASPLETDVAPVDVGNMLNDVYDLYRFDGSCEGAEWRNFKNSANNGFTTLSFGHGYLYANSNNVTLQFVGPKSVADSYTVDLTSSPAKLGKWNLIGNSFTDAATVSVSDYYRIEDSDRSVIVLSSGQVNAMEGIFVEYSATLEEVTFTKATRGARAFGSPMVNIDLRDAEGRLLDRARLRTGEGASMGKLDLMSDPNRLYFRMDGKDYAVVRVNGEGEMPLNFDAAQDGSFTLSVKVEGMDMGYLHLVDNLTGADVDLLATSTGSEATYTFTAKTTDYASRFRLVFSEDGGSSTGSAATNFAYISNGNIVITNASANATLQVIDVMGRVIVSVGGHTRCVPTSGIPGGVYVLRLVSGDDVKTQKIIIE